MLMGVIAVGTTCHILHRQVMATTYGESNVTTSVGTLLYDRFMNQQRAHRFFKNRPLLSFIAFSSDGKSAWWDGDFVDKGPVWTDMVAVFIVDLLYQEAQVLEKRSKIEPLKWALWRMFLITKFDASAFVSHEELRAVCAQWVEDQAKLKEKLDSNERIKRTRDYRFLSTARGCDVINK
uniref:GST C-terminal domain-containing protein n=1 Tax=Angiostrongylus cantonensis TaxID=6313 RepID=A0A0K0D6Q8_ANGCA